MSTTDLCTQPVDANPDVSGLGTLIAFYAQAIINLSVGARYLALVFLHPRHKCLRKWTGAVLLDLVNSWIAVGIAMMIAAFSQWRTLSTFHLLICSNLASTIPMFNPMTMGVLDYRSSRSLLQRSYFAFYGMLRLAISTYLIYRFRFWGNTSGRCFVIPRALPHIDVRVPLILGTAVRIVWDLVFTVGLLHWVIWETLGWWEARRVPMEVRLGVEREVPWEVKVRLVHLSVITFVVPFIWNACWTITIVLANQGHVLGDEYSLTFGQVGALVAFAASFYAIWSSYLNYREQQMHSSTSDSENLKENKPSEDPETILPDGNTLLPTRAVELDSMRCERLAKVASRHTI